MGNRALRETRHHRALVGHAPPHKLAALNEALRRKLGHAGVAGRKPKGGERLFLRYGRAFAAKMRIQGFCL